MLSSRTEGKLSSAKQADGRIALKARCFQRPLSHPALVKGSDLQRGVFPSTFSMPQPFLLKKAEGVLW